MVCPPLWPSLALRNCGADDWLEALGISGAVVHIEPELHLPFAENRLWYAF